MNHRPEGGRSTPEEAVLSGYSSAAEARVVRTDVLDADHVGVIIDSNPSHPMRCHASRLDGRWYDGGDIVE